MKALKDAEIEDWSRVIIAYEALWAMSTGIIASPDQITDITSFIRNWIRENIGSEQAELTRIVYGGNLTTSNVNQLIKLPEVDGFLMGSSTSTKPVFRTLFDSVNEYVKNGDN